MSPLRGFYVIVPDEYVLRGAVPQPRYSEDIDLVQVKAEPIKETIDHLRDALAWLGEPLC